MKPIIRIIHNLPRSGGTLLARYLGCMDGVILLSEIHPIYNAAIDPVTQARQWFGYPIREGLPFLDTIEEIRTAVSAERKILVIRDWSFHDFLSNHEHHVRRSRLVDALADRYELRRIFLLRRDNDVWKSLQKFEDRANIIFGRLTREAFQQGYIAFENMARSVGFFRYEDLCRDPSTTMQRVCDKLDIPFDQDFIVKWMDYKKVTGDVQSFDRSTRNT